MDQNTYQRGLVQLEREQRSLTNLGKSGLALVALMANAEIEAAHAAGTLNAAQRKTLEQAAERF